MGRETKLALIVGLVVFLVTAVVVGEHFSKARQANASIDKGSTISELQTADALPPSIEAPVRTATLSPKAPTPGVTDPALTLADTAGTKASDEAKALIIRMGSKAPAAAQTAERQNQIDPNNPSGMGTGMANSTGLGTRSDLSSSGLEYSKFAETSYVTVSGDTISKIASRIYGDSQLYKQLAEYNKGKLGTNYAMSTGVTLRIPPKDVLLGQRALRPEARGVTASATGSTAPISPPTNFNPSDIGRPDKPSGPNTPTTLRTYTVKKGDTLTTIAEKQLGSMMRWKELRTMNKDQIKDEADLKIGIVLKLPAAGPSPSTTSSSNPAR